MTHKQSNPPKKKDYKKEYKDLYLPSTKPGCIEVPSLPYFMVAGTGNPNNPGGEYAHALEILYGLSYSVKMSKMGDAIPPGYFEYVVPPLEGLWWLEGYHFDGTPIKDKGVFQWISMIRQPEFVTTEVFEQARESLSQKKPELDLAKAHFETFDEGLCAQIMHIGSYDSEGESIKKMLTFIHEEGYCEDISDQHDAFPLQRRHHEIYLSDPRKVAPEKMKTVIRHPIRTA